jgi:hypothetical protein
MLKGIFEMFEEGKDLFTYAIGVGSLMLKKSFKGQFKYNLKFMRGGGNGFIKETK